MTVDGKFLQKAGNGSEETCRKRILFFTSSEYGQANVVLAVIHEFLLRREYQVHVASFAPLKARIEEASRTSRAEKGDGAVFHTVPGPSALEALTAKDEFIGPYPPGIKGALETYRVTLPAMATTWDEDTYMTSYESCKQILETIHPDVIVVDPLFSQGLEACAQLSRDCVVLSPNTLQDVLRKKQPWYSFFRYPALSSAFPYPVPWSLVLTNAYLKFRMLLILVTSPTVKKLIEWRKARKLPALPPVFDVWQPQNHYLVPSMPETDFPCHLQSNVTPCGPILLPALSVSEVDAELHSWLLRGSTVLINLGSHIRMDSTVTREFAKALKILLDKRPDVQVLWKRKTSGGLALRENALSKPMSGGFKGTDSEKDSLDPISNEISSDRVRILEWLSVDPLAVLQSGHVVCSVHHGGSNSFHEALSAGVPQVVLPCWLDTFEFANRVEYLGIGVYGSRNAAPRVEADELSRALWRVLSKDKESTSMKKNAEHLAVISGRVGGRVKAYEKILELLERR